MGDLLNLNDYCAITFTSTSQALKAEKVMKQAGAQFLTMPTPREVSTSCGLSIKVSPENVDKYYRMLLANRVSVEKVFRLTKNGHKTSVRIINPPEESDN